MSRISFFWTINAESKILRVIAPMRMRSLESPRERPPGAFWSRRISTEATGLETIGPVGYWIRLTATAQFLSPQEDGSVLDRFADSAALLFKSQDY